MPAPSPILPPGPWKTLDAIGGGEAPFYVIPFDKNGNTVAPRTRDALLADLSTHRYSDIFLFSHGWKNAWPSATDKYERFIAEYQSLRRDHGLTLSRDDRPLLIGIFWPSTILIDSDERAPEMAASDPQAARATAADDYLTQVGELASLLPAGDVQRFYQLAQENEGLGDAEARELAAMLAPLYPDDIEGAGGDGAKETSELSAEDVLILWRLLEPRDAASETSGGLVPGFVDQPAGGRSSSDAQHADAQPEAAFLRKLLPRKLIRQFTVWKMKDRAGKVGTHGVGPLLRAVKDRVRDARIHLIGHSYGTKVILSALCSELFANGDGAVHSMLLLQPAINGFAFSGDVAGEGFPGGYRSALERVRMPILSTFSRHDVPLTKAFHLGVRRELDLGELRTAARAPSRLAALGGFGPQGMRSDEHREIPMAAPGDAYDFPPDGPKIYGVNADRFIKSHSDIINPATAWALWSLVSASEGDD